MTGFGYDKKHTFSNVIKQRDGIKQFLGKYFFVLNYGRNIKVIFLY